MTTNRSAQNGSTNADMPSIRLTRRGDRSILMAILHMLIKPFNGRLVKPKKAWPAGSPRVEVDKKAAKKLDATARRVDEIYIYDLSTKHTSSMEKQKTRRLYYFAGGGWQMPASSEHWAFLTEMTAKLPGIAVSLVSYPLAPNSPAPVAIPQLMKMYRTLMEEAHKAGEEVIMAGDSAGGNVVLSIIINALWEDAESGSGDSTCPKAVMVVCPSTDLSRENPDMRKVEKHDPLLKMPFVESTATAWRGQWPSSDVRVSPMFADLSPLMHRGVQVHGLTAGYDILSVDARLFRDKLNQAGVHGEWLDWDKQMHCFPLAFSFGLRESVEAKDWILDVLRRV